jgi:hypothetical protein
VSDSFVEAFGESDELETAFIDEKINNLDQIRAIGTRAESYGGCV